MSWYLENMRNLPNEYPETYYKYMMGNFAVKTKPESFNLFVTIMKLEQTIQWAKEKLKEVLLVREEKLYIWRNGSWYHETLAIFALVTKITNANWLVGELVFLKQNLIRNLVELSHPYIIASNFARLHYFRTGHCMPEKATNDTLKNF